MKKYMALINPKGSSLGRNKNFIEFSKEFKGFSQKYWSGYNSGLLIVAALTPEDFEMKYIDENYEEIDYTEEFDLVCLSGMTQQATQAYRIADRFREKGVKTVMGGIHATVMPEETKEHVDTVVIGEAEGVWHNLINDFCNNSLQPFYKAETVTDPRNIPSPRFDLLKTENYSMMWLQATRGCPWNCEFCVASNVFGRSYRYKEIGQIINELKIIRDIGKGEICFGDDNLLVNRKYSYELLKQIAPLNIRWSAESDISVSDDDKLLALMAKSGCSKLFIGFECISEENLRTLNGMEHKLKYVNRYPELIRKIQSYGIGVNGAFIIGLEGDDKSTFKKVADFIIDNYLYGAQIAILTPYPGTKLRERLSIQKRILPTDWENYTIFDANYIPAKMTPNELEDGLVYIFRRIYAPEVRMRNAKHFKEIYSNLRKAEQCEKL